METIKKTEAVPDAVVMQLFAGALEGLLGIVQESTGVAGWHLNGDVAGWDEFEEVRAAEEALKLHRKQGPWVPAFSDEDHVYIPRGLIHAACSAIDKKRDGEKTLAELRRYTTGDLSRQPAPDTSRLAEALERLVLAAQCRDNSTGDQIRLIETRAELSAAAKNAEEALAAYHKQEAEKPRWHVELIE